MPSTAQPTVTKLVHGADGSYKRNVSTFRDLIVEGGEFEPEKGALRPACRVRFAKAEAFSSQGATIYM